MQELDEFTGHRLKKIALHFCEVYKKHGRKHGSEYLSKENIKPEHYPVVRVMINERLQEMGLKI